MQDIKINTNDFFFVVNKTNGKSGFCLYYERYNTDDEKEMYYIVFEPVNLFAVDAITTDVEFNDKYDVVESSFNTDERFKTILISKVDDVICKLKYRAEGFEDGISDAEFNELSHNDEERRLISEYRAQAFVDKIKSKEIGKFVSYRTSDGKTTTFIKIDNMFVHWTDDVYPELYLTGHSFSITNSIESDKNFKDVWKYGFHESFLNVGSIDIMNYLKRHPNTEYYDDWRPYKNSSLNDLKNLIEDNINAAKNVIEKIFNQNETED